MTTEKTKKSNWRLLLYGVLAFTVIGMCMRVVNDQGTEKNADLTSASSVKNDGPDPNKAALDSLEKIRENTLRAEAEKKLAKLRKKVDDMEGVTFYDDPTTTKYIDQNSFHVYIGKNERGCWLRFRIQYAADDWLFVQGFKVKADSVVYDIVPTKRVDRDNSGGRIWETWDESVDLDKYTILKKVAESKSAKLRYIGQQHYDERIITDKEKASLRNMLEIFEGLGCAFH